MYDQNKSLNLDSSLEAGDKFFEKETEPEQQKDYDSEQYNYEQRVKQESQQEFRCVECKELISKGDLCYNCYNDIFNPKD